MTELTEQDRLLELQRELGRLCMGFAYFETAVACAVGFLANRTEFAIGHILVAELSFRARLAMFSTLYPQRVPAADEAAVNSFIADAHMLEEERNKLVHSFYWPGPVGDPKATRIKTTAKERKGLRIQFEDVSPSVIAAQADKAWKIPDCLDELMLKCDGYCDYVAGFYGKFQKQ